MAYLQFWYELVNAPHIKQAIKKKSNMETIEWERRQEWIKWITNKNLVVKNYKRMGWKWNMIKINKKWKLLKVFFFFLLMRWDRI